MKQAATILGVALGAMALSAQAASHADYARVVQVVPEYVQVASSRQQCTTEYVPVAAQPMPVARERSYGGTVVGGLVGAALGSRLGKGNGSKVGTAAGAIVGAIVGDQLDNRDEGYAATYQPAYHGYQQAAAQPVQRCYTVPETENQLQGYRVTYEYAGRHYTTVMPEHPGQRLRVQVEATPLESRRGAWQHSSYRPRGAYPVVRAGYDR